MAYRAYGVSFGLVIGASLFAMCAKRNANEPSARSVWVANDTDEKAAQPNAPRTRTCPIEKPSVEERGLGALIELGEWNGTSWVIAKADRDGGLAPVLLHLDAQGRLVETDVPELTEYAAFEAPGRLHFLDPGTKTRAWSASIVDPDAARAADIKTGPLLLSERDGGYDSGARVKAFAVAGNRALISVYRHHYLGNGKNENWGETALYDWSSLKPTSAIVPFTTWRAVCSAARCVGIATANDDRDRAVVIEIDERGERHQPLGSWGCAGWPDWRNGSKWLIAWQEASKLNAISIDLETGEKRTGKTSSVANPDCAALEIAEIAGRHGVILTKQKSFVPVDADARFGTEVRMPEMTFDRQKYAPLPDGALVLDYSASHSMTHSPTDSRGFREYHSEWSFSGKSGFVKPNERGLALGSRADLPLSGSEGEFGDGATVIPLVRGSYSGAIVGAGYRASFVLLSRPCE